MALVIDAGQADALTQTLTQQGETIFRLGHITPRRGEPVCYV
jgi:phosphoribosylaminoimidazole (AIR) synthetase